MKTAPKEKTTMCPHCGKLFGTPVSRLIPTHDWPPITRQVCPGTGQTPRYAPSDKRPLWKDLKENE